MFKYIQLIVSITLFSVFAQATVAETKANPNQRVRFFSGHPSEKLEIVFVLDKHVVIGGVSKVMSANECEASVTIEVSDATGEKETQTVTEEISFSYTKMMFNYRDYTPEGSDSSHILVRLIDFQKRGPCRLFSNIRQARENGETLFSVANDAPVTGANFLQVVN